MERLKTPIFKFLSKVNTMENNLLKEIPPIEVRKISLPFSDIDNKYFYNNNAIISTLLAYMSASFPGGEKGFIDSVRYYESAIDDPDLKNRVKSFIGQEGHHSHQHRRVNKALANIGLAADKVEESHAKRVTKDRQQWNPKNFLAYTVGMEHFTAIIAEYALKNPEVFEPLSPSVRNLLLWHAVEEIEHKSVAFEVYETCVGGKTRLNVMMAYGTILNLVRIGAGQFEILKETKEIPKFSDIGETMTLLFGKKGLITGITKPYLDFFKAGFHPWENGLIDSYDDWKQKLDVY